MVVLWKVFFVRVVVNSVNWTDPWLGSDTAPDRGAGAGITGTGTGTGAGSFDKGIETTIIPAFCC